MLAAASLQDLAPMTLGDLGSIANLLAAIGVLVRLIYPSRRTKIGTFDREQSRTAS